MPETYRCGNCKGNVSLRTVKLSSGELASAWVCESCGESWFPHQIKRDIEWQRREDERKLKYAARVHA